MQDHSVRLAFGTDYPVEPINPLRGIYESHHPRIAGRWSGGRLAAQEKLPIADCLRNYTAGSAYAEFEEATKGNSSDGNAGGRGAYPQDITRMATADLLQLPVWTTIAGGRVVYEAEARAPKAPNTTKEPK